MKTEIHKANSRGYAKHGWLETYHSFSFADYYNPKRMGFGVLRVINDDTIAPGAGFGEHPHRDMEIITIPLTGSLAHRDSLGNSATIKTGEVQVMSAGTGVVHSEYNATEKESVSLLQIWIETGKPAAEPRYDQKAFDAKEWNTAFRLVVGPLGDITEKEGVLGIHQDAYLTLGTFDPNAEARYELKDSKHGVYVFVIEGEVQSGDTVLGKRDALGISEIDHFTLLSRAKSTLLLIEVPL